MFVMALFLLVPLTTDAQSAVQKQLQKQLKKEYKQKMKQLKKEGWQLFASSHTLEVALLTHYDKLAQLGENGSEFVGIAQGTENDTDNAIYQAARNNAANSYAQTAGSTLRGRLTNDVFVDANEDNGFDKFYSAYETLVEKEIKGELKPSFAVCREFDKNKKSIQIYYILDEDAASKARIRALENAMKESEAAQKYADKVSDFVREGFKK